MKRVEKAIRKKVEESLQSEKIKTEILTLLEEGRKRVDEQVAAQLEKEKEPSLIEAKEKEGVMRCLSLESEQRGREEMVENRGREPEALRKEAMERQRKEEERYWDLEELQRQREEAMRKKKAEEEEERLKQMKLLGKNTWKVFCCSDMHLHSLSKMFYYYCWRLFFGVKPFSDFYYLVVLLL